MSHLIYIVKAALVKNIIYMLALQIIAWDVIMGSLWAEQKSFDTLGLTATVPTSSDVQRKYISYVMPARSPSESSIQSK